MTDTYQFIYFPLAHSFSFPNIRHNFFYIFFTFFSILASSLFVKPTTLSLPLQAIQDMNSLKRFVRQAEMSHYALFRCCQFLQGCGNGDVLLQNARVEHSDLPEACSIITVLEEFLREQSQAQAWSPTDVHYQQTSHYNLKYQISWENRSCRGCCVIKCVSYKTMFWRLVVRLGIYCTVKQWQI